MEPYLLERDVYFHFWVSTLVPVYDPHNYHLDIVRANRWSRRALPNSYVYGSGPERQYHSLLKLVPDRPFLEKISRRLQEGNFPPGIAELVNVDSRVVVNDKVLKFHENDRRRQYQERFEEGLARLI
jgi:hypothetical protein